MIINFAAANMAGYNNPVIDVFEGVLGETGLISAPSKSVLVNCTTRGAIPIIMLTTPDHSSWYMLHLVSYETLTDGLTAVFACADASIRLHYTGSSEQPTLVT